MITYDDFVFWDRDRGNVLATESLQTDLAGDFAQRLARKHQTTVAYAVVVEYFVTPDKCEKCGEIRPETGPCWCSSFEEEEANAKPEILKAD